MIGRAHQNNILDYPQSYRLKKKVKSLYDHEVLTKKEEGGKGLESKIQKSQLTRPVRTK